MTERDATPTEARQTDGVVLEAVRGCRAHLKERLCANPKCRRIRRTVRIRGDQSKHGHQCVSCDQPGTFEVCDCVTT